MKRLIFILLATLTFAVLTTSCDGTRTIYTYKVTYTNGDTETLRVYHEAWSYSESDCWSIGGKRCGIRKINLIKKTEVQKQD